MLEPGRTLTLAERGGAGVELITAHPEFRIVATMNPGGDYGKKELSPALSNRFTSIWVPAIEDLGELHAILDSRLPGTCRCCIAAAAAAASAALLGLLILLLLLILLVCCH